MKKTTSFIYIILFLFILGLVVVSIINYQQNKILEKEIASLKRGEIRKEVEGPEGEIKTRELEEGHNEVLGEVVSLDEKNKRIKVKDAFGEMTLNYTDATFFYLYETMTDEEYKQAMIEYEKEMQRILELEEEELEKAFFPEQPFQEIYRQFEDISELNISAGDSVKLIIKDGVILEIVKGLDKKAF